MTGLANKSNSSKPRLVGIRNLISRGGIEVMPGNRYPSTKWRLYLLQNCLHPVRQTSSWVEYHTHPRLMGSASQLAPGRPFGFIRILRFKQWKLILTDLVAKKVANSQNHYEGWDPAQSCAAKNDTQNHAVETKCGHCYHRCC